MKFRFERHHSQEPQKAEAAIAAEKAVTMKGAPQVDEKSQEVTFGYIATNSAVDQTIKNFVEEAPADAINTVRQASPEDLRDPNHTSFKVRCGLFNAAVIHFRRDPSHPLAERVGRLLYEKEEQDNDSNQRVSTDRT